MTSSRIFFSFAGLLLVIEIYSLLPYRKQVKVVDNPQSKWVLGAINVQSHYSDGGGTVEEIAYAAQQSKLGFVILTDFNSSEARRLGEEKSFSGVDVFVEMKTSAPAGNLLVFYSHTGAVNLKDSAISDLAWRHFQGERPYPELFLIAAHPSHVKKPWNILNRFPEGLEVLNLESQFYWERDEHTMELLMTTLLAPFNRFLSAIRFLRMDPREFATWDSLITGGLGRVGIVGSEAKSNIEVSSRSSLRLPKYENYFKVSANAVQLTAPLPDNFTDRKKSIYSAIRAGRVALFFPLLFPFEGNDLYVQCGDQRFEMADTIAASLLPCDAVVQTPLGFPFQKSFRVVRDTDVVGEADSSQPTHRFSIKEPGAYRFEVWAKAHTLTHLLQNHKVPYVLYNPLYVR